MAGIDPRYSYLTLGLLALCTIIGIAVAFRFQREVDHDLAPSTEKDLLEPLEKAYFSGLMDEAEFHRIREAMERQQPGKTAPAARSSPRTKMVTPQAGIPPKPDPDAEAGED